jgi:hypothetical protein
VGENPKVNISLFYHNILVEMMMKKGIGVCKNIV